MPKAKPPVGLAFNPETTPAVYLQWAEKTAGIKPQGTYSTQDMLNLCTLVGYAADRPALSRAFDSGLIEKPERKEGRCYVWSRDEIYGFIRGLEARRAWQPIHPFHHHKMTPAEIKKGKQTLQLQKEFIEDVNRMETREVLSLMVRTDEESNRRLVAAVLSHRLGLLKSPVDALRN